MKKTLLLIAMLTGASCFAQNSYTLTTYTEVYAPLVGATAITDFGEDEDGAWDDPEFEVPLGFTFEIGGQAYTTALQMGPGAIIGFLNIPDSTIHIFGFLDDFADASDIPGVTPSLISYKIEGNPGNYIAKIQYENAGFYNEIYGMEPSAEDRMSFQLWLYEDSGILEVHYGPSNILDPLLAFEGNSGPTFVIATHFDFTNYEFLGIIAGHPADPNLLGVTPEAEDIIGLNSIPASGRVHRLTPSATVGMENAKTPGFIIYPTIAQNEIWIKDAHVANSAYRIVDISGKQVKTGNLKDESRVDVSDLKTGVYIFSIDRMANAVKFVKE